MKLNAPLLIDSVHSGLKSTGRVRHKHGSSLFPVTRVFHYETTVEGGKGLSRVGELWVSTTMKPQRISGHRRCVRDRETAKRAKYTNVTEVASHVKLVAVGTHLCVPTYLALYIKYIFNLYIIVGLSKSKSSPPLHRLIR